MVDAIDGIEEVSALHKLEGLNFVILKANSRCASLVPCNRVSVAYHNPN